jgi:SAM-dependent methyltransferase
MSTRSSPSSPTLTTFSMSCARVSWSASPAAREPFSTEAPLEAGISNGSTSGTQRGSSGTSESRHSPRPPDPLPPKVEWLQRNLGDLSPIDDGSVDLVFAGQVIEHLWPEDVAGFLAEAHRVLRPGGFLALDSPNRLVTESSAGHNRSTLSSSPMTRCETCSTSPASTS